MKVIDPQGRTWRVSRRWVPWRRRTSTGGWGDSGPTVGNLGDDPISMAIGCFTLVLLLPFIVLAIIVALEMLLLLLLLPFAVLGRVLLGRHRRVEVREGWAFAWETEAGSWSERGRAIEHVAEGLRMGVPPWRAVHPRRRRARSLPDRVLHALPEQPRGARHDVRGVRVPARELTRADVVNCWLTHPWMSIQY